MSNGDQGLTGPPDTPPISVSVFDIAPPDSPTALPRIHLEQYFRDTYDLLNHQWKVPSYIASIIAGLILVVPATVLIMSTVGLTIIKPFLPAFGGAVFEVIDEIRKALDPQFAQFSVAVLNELMGTDFTVDHFAQGEDVNAHLARAEEIGYLFHKQLMTEFLANTGVSLGAGGPQFSEPTGPSGAGEKITPMGGVRAAARFSGLAINFGTATGIIGTIGGLVPEVHLNEIREIGEEVAKNLGLGRLQRLALAPIVQILLAEPYKWFINELARPTQFGLGEVVNPFSGSVMPAELIWRDLARAGYSDDKIQAVLELHRKKLDEGSVFALFEGGHMTEDDVLAYYKRLGYSDDDAQRKKEADLLKANRAFADELRSAVVTAYADGHIQRDEMVGIINGLPLRQEERDYIILAADYKRKVPTKHLTLAELNTGLADGIIDLTEYNDHLTLQGYSDDDQSILLLEELTKIDNAKAKAAATAARATAKAAKAAGGSASPLPPTAALGG